MGIAPSNYQIVKTGGPEQLITPSFTNMTMNVAKNEAKKSGLNLEVLGKVANVVEQFPGPGTKVHSTQSIYVQCTR